MSKAQVQNIVPFKTSAIFCRLCGMMLKIESAKSQAECRFCNNVTNLNELVGDVVVTKKELNQKKDWLEGTHDRQKKERATVQEDCPKCGHDIMYFTTMQLRSADEGQTVFYECVKCSYTFSVAT